MSSVTPGGSLHVPGTQAGLESLSSTFPEYEPVPDVGRGPRGEASARPAGVGGLRYPPAVQNRLPDTFIGTNDAGWGAPASPPPAAGISSRRDRVEAARDHECQPAQGHDVGYFTAGHGAGGCAGAMAYYTGSGEPPGQWHGNGAKLLGLSGKVDPA